MPRLLDRAPIPESPSEVVINGERLRLRANQIVVWLTVTRRLDDPPRRTTVPFPAILDTGHTHSLSLQERHLNDWARLRPDDLLSFGTVRDRGQRLQLRTATVWVYPTRSKSGERAVDRSPLPLGRTRGIAVYPRGVEFPRLPILGLQAITDNRFVLVVNGHRREATLRTAYRWWPFAGR